MLLTVNVAITCAVDFSFQFTGTSESNDSAMNSAKVCIWALIGLAISILARLTYIGRLHMLRTEPDTDRARRYPAQQWPTPQKLHGERKREWLTASKDSF